MIDKIAGIAGMRSLKILSLGRNYIKSLAGIVRIFTQAENLVINTMRRKVRLSIIITFFPPYSQDIWGRRKMFSSCSHPCHHHLFCYVILHTISAVLCSSTHLGTIYPSLFWLHFPPLFTLHDHSRNDDSPSVYQCHIRITLLYKYSL